MQDWTRHAAVKTQTTNDNANRLHATLQGESSRDDLRLLHQSQSLAGHPRQRLAVVDQRAQLRGTGVDGPLGTAPPPQGRRPAQRGQNQGGRRRQRPRRAPGR